MRKTKRNGENSHKKHFTVIDLLICIIAISAVVYVGFRFFGTDDSEKTPKVLYSVSFLIPDEKQDVFKEGDVVLTSDGENVIGEISKISFAPATKKVFDLTGGIYEDNNSSVDSSADVPVFDTSDVSVDTTYNPENSETNDSLEEISQEESKEIDVENVVHDTVVEGFQIMTVTVEGELELVNGNYTINGIYLKIGEAVEITTKDYAMIGKCVSIITNENE